MTYTEPRTLGYAIAGSLALHMAIVVALAIWFGFAVLHRIHLPEPVAMVEENDVTLVFPEPAPPPPPKEQERYIRTTQNTVSPEAPAKADFVSDKNTVAMAKVAPPPDGDLPLPTMKGVDYPTAELADRKFRDGETKNDSAPTPPKPSPDIPEAKPAPPAPPRTLPQIVKKEDARTETMMKELDAALAKQDAPPEPKLQDQPPEPPRDTVPTMRTPEERSMPPAIPVAIPVANTPRPEKDAFQPETHRSSKKGSISNSGAEDAVNATVTPVGRYMRQVTSAIEKKWHQYRIARADAVEPGKMGLRFFVNKNGKVEDLEFLFKESNALMEDFTIEAILKADIPPIPKDLLPILERERVEITYDIVIHP